jgi:hypothetical protein
LGQPQAVRTTQLQGAFVSIRRASVIAGLALLGLPATASAAPEWVTASNFAVPADDVSIGGGQAQTQVLYQDGGIATLAFLQIESISPTVQSTLHIGTIAPGGTYSEQLTIPSTEAGTPAGVQIAVAPDGAAVATWPELIGDTVAVPDRYRAAYRPAGSSAWEAPVTIATDTVVEKGISDLLTPAISANGTAAVGVQHFAPGESTGLHKRPNYRIDVAVHPAGASWQPAARISPVGKSATNLSLGFDAAGDLTAAYTVRYVEGSEESEDLRTVIVRDRPAASGVWGVEENINKEEIPWTAFAPYLGENESGDAVVTYQYADSSSDATWAATRQGPNGSWTTPAQLTSGGSAPTAAGVSPNGEAYVLYGFQGSSSGESCAGVERAQAGQSFSSERCLSPTGENAFDGSLAFLGNDAYFAWRSEVPGESQNASIQGARWGGASTLPDVARNLDTPGLDYGDPTLVSDDQGSLVAFYANPSGELRAAALDGGPPILLGASVPVTATVGRALAFSASFVDLWSGLGAGQPTWSFGDGSGPVAGATVTHTFTAPGVYTVTLGAADALGNAASATYGVTVTPASLSGPPPPSRRPVVTLHVPACPKKLSKKACKRFQASRAAWQTLTGRVTDPAPSSAIASVQVAVYLTSGGRIEGLSGKRFRKTTKVKARATFVRAKVSGTRWSLRLPKLKPGTYTILVRAIDRAGRISATIVKTLQLH